MESQEFRLLTLNLWWGEYHQKERLEAVRDLVEFHKPDFIAFQEISARALDAFKELFRGFQIWPGFPGYAGTAILSKGRWLERGQLRLTSSMGRELCWWRIDDLTVATVHLESTEGQREARIEQLSEVFEHLSRYPRVVLMGDFNFAPDWPENAHLSSDYLDAWSFLHPEDPGFTENTSVNLMRLQQSGKEKQVRFDRILCKGGLKPRSIELVGTIPLPGLRDVWPSDHFGLLCDVELTSQPPVRGEQILMLGKLYKTYGTYTTKSVGNAVVSMSVGGDPESPSMAAKARKDMPNEDALLVSKHGTSYLLAVADGHFGNATSHALLQRLAGKPFPANLESLVETVHAVQKPALQVGSGSTLTVAVFDRESGTGFGASTGDSTLATIVEGRLQTHTEDNARFVYFNRPLLREEWHRFEFQIPPYGLLTLYTDGVNECHYRSPETSIQPQHMTTLWEQTGQQLETYTKMLTQLALDGVLGAPGGQDNIALICQVR